MQSRHTGYKDQCFTRTLRHALKWYNPPYQLYRISIKSNYDINSCFVTNNKMSSLPETRIHTENTYVKCILYA